MKNKLIKLFKIGVLFFGVSLSLYNCGNENIIDSQETIVENKFQKLFNKQDFKQVIPFDYQVNWNNPNKQYSEDLKTDFYEFELTYNTPFNPTTINKSKKEGYNTAYKLIATENNDNKIRFFIAKFFQKKDGQIEIENLNISLNNNSGYKGLTHLYNSDNELYFAKKVNLRGNKKNKCYFKDENLKTKNSNTAAKDVTVCTTTTLYHYIDWYRYTYDAYGNLIDVVYLYTEYVGSSNTTTCNTEFQPDEPIRIIRNPDHVPCNDGTGRTNCVKYIEPQILCEVGFEPDGNGGCKEVSKIPTEDDDKINLDSSFKNSIANCAYKLLVENKQFNQILDKLIPKNSKYDVTFIVDRTDSSGGKTNATYNSLFKNITVTINKDLVDTGNIIAIVETILHEAVHARLFEQVKSLGGLDKLGEFSNEDSEIGKLAAYYNKYKDNRFQHEFIWSNYVDEIAKGTEAIHKLFPDNYNRFHSYMTGTNGYNKETFYQKVAQAGLSKTSYFKSLSDSEQKIILNMYSALKSNGKKITDYKTCK